MRFLLTSLLAVLLVNTILAETFKDEKLELGKSSCTCTLTLEAKGNKCSGKGKCDRKCSGAGTVELGIFSFTLSVKKGKAKISKCSAEEEESTTAGSGSGEQPITILPPGSGSGEQPVSIPPTGSGSGPKPPTGGSGSGPAPPVGEGMQCSCKCDCPDGSGECACDCNCPMQSSVMYCASGFTKVCPMTADMCPMDMEKVCPMMPQSRMDYGNADGNGKGCQCVPDFLMALVHHAMPPAATRFAATNRGKVQAAIKVGNRDCKCSFDMKDQNGSCLKSKGGCDKKCSGAATGVELMEGMYVLDMKVKKGKVTITNCEVNTPETGTGSGTMPGSGSGTMPGAGSGSGEGGMGSRCACVAKGGEGSGPNPPTGSGSGPVTLPTPAVGSGTEPPTGSGSGVTEVTEGPTGPTIPNPGSAASELTLSISQTWAQEPSGYERTAVLTVPATTAGQKVPVVFHLHGNGGQGNTRPVGDWLGEECIIVAPNGYERSWNVYTEKSKADDVGFIIDLIAKIGAEIPAADMNNVNIIGTSNGAALTYSLIIQTGADRPFRRAFPMVSSLISPQYHDNAFWKPTVSAAAGEANTHDISVVPEFAAQFEYAHFHGTEDGALKYDGQSPGPSFLGGADVLSAQLTDFLWAKAMGYTGDQITDSAGVSIGTDAKPVEEYKYLDGRVRHYKLIGEGHSTGPGHVIVQETVKAMIFA